MKISLQEAYQNLNVTSKSTDAEVKASYRKLALKTHPDKNPNDPEASKKFLKVSEAYKRITEPGNHEDEEEMGDYGESEMFDLFEMMMRDVMFGGSKGKGRSFHGFGAMPSGMFREDLGEDDDEDGLDFDELYEEDDDLDDMADLLGSLLGGGNGFRGDGKKNSKNRRNAPLDPMDMFGFDPSVFFGRQPHPHVRTSKTNAGKNARQKQRAKEMRNNKPAVPKAAGAFVRKTFNTAHPSMVVEEDDGSDGWSTASSEAEEMFQYLRRNSHSDNVQSSRKEEQREAFEKPASLEKSADLRFGGKPGTLPQLSSLASSNIKKVPSQEASKAADTPLPRMSLDRGSIAALAREDNVESGLGSSLASVHADAALKDKQQFTIGDRVTIHGQER